MCVCPSHLVFVQTNKNTSFCEQKSVLMRLVDWRLAGQFWPYKFSWGSYTNNSFALEALSNRFLGKDWYYLIIWFDIIKWYTCFKHPDSENERTDECVCSVNIFFFLWLASEQNGWSPFPHISWSVEWISFEIYLDKSKFYNDSKKKH